MCVCGHRLCKNQRYLVFSKKSGTCPKCGNYQQVCALINPIEPRRPRPEHLRPMSADYFHWCRYRPTKRK